MLIIDILREKRKLHELQSHLSSTAFEQYKRIISRRTKTKCWKNTVFGQSIKDVIWSTENWAVSFVKMNKSDVQL